MNQLSAKSPSRSETLLFLLVVLLPLLLFCLWLVPGKGFENDVGTFWAWSKRLSSLPFSKFYEEGYFCDYLPSYLYVLWAIGSITDLLNVPFDSYLGRLLLKSPAILAHLATVYLFFLFCRKIYPRSGHSQVTMFLLTYAVAFWPAQLNNAASFGQVDAVFNLLAFAMLLCLTSQRIYLAAVLYAILFGFKPHALFYVPLLLVFGMRDRWLFKFEKMATAAFLFCVVTFGLFFPFWIGRLEGAITQYQAIIGSYAYATLNAFNFYQFIGWNWKPLAEAKMFGMPLFAFFLVTILGLSGYVGYGIYQSYKRDRQFLYWDYTQVILTGALYVMFIFLFAPKMHERYLMPIFPLMIMIFGHHRHNFLAYIIIGFMIAISQDIVIDHYFGAKQAVSGPAVAYGSLLVIVAAGILLHRFQKTVVEESKKSGDGKTVFLQNLRPDGQRNMLALMYINFKNSLRNLPTPKKLTNRDFGFLFLLMMGNIFIHFYQLGDTRIPSTKFAPRGTVTFQFPANVQLSRVWIYGHTATGNLHFTCGTEPENKVNADFGVTNYYAWKSYKLPRLCRNSIDMAAENLGQDSIGEIQFISNSGNIILPNAICSEGDCSADRNHPAIDETDPKEQDYAYRTSTYFDEVYYARAAIELNQGRIPYESTHPPLGKVLAALVVQQFGTAPFQWRSLGSLLGCFLPFIVFFICWHLTYNRGAAFFCSLLATLEFSKLTLSRMYTIDVYVTFWLLLAYLFIFIFTLRYLRNVKDSSQFRLSAGSFWPLLATGGAIGLGLATKWITVFTFAAILGLSGLIILVEWYRRGNSNSPLKSFPWEILGAILITLVAIPPVFYFLGYIPYYFLLQNGFSFQGFLNNQVSMWSYHSGLKATHFFSSKFYTWPFVHLPVWLHSGETGSSDTKRTIVMIGNPLIWWATIPAFVSLFYFKDLRQKLYLMLLGFAFLAQYFPWIIASRITFMYHYFPSAMIGLIIVAIVLYRDDSTFMRWLRYSYLAGTIILFLMFWPVVTGEEVAASYVNDWLRWFPNWYF